MPNLIVAHHVYHPAALDGWTNRRRDAIRFPAGCTEFARLLKKKRRRRSKKTSRFFGEAYVASKIRPREAYYSSCKWLTNSRFAITRKLADADHERLRSALHRHFGQSRIERLQRAVWALSDSSHTELHKKTPTAPDLWLVDSKGRHRFIEVKLPGDCIAPHQLAGMAAISCLLNGPDRRVSVEVIHLNDSTTTPQRFNDDAGTFKAFCRAIRAG